MLSLVFRRLSSAPRALIRLQRAPAVTAKILNDKKKKLYESQSLEAKKSNTTAILLTPEQRREREAVFNQIIFEIGKDTMLCFSNKSANGTPPFIQIKNTQIL